MEQQLLEKLLQRLDIVWLQNYALDGGDQDTQTLMTKSDGYLHAREVVRDYIDEVINQDVP
jgi:hypothetical protein